VEGGGEVLRHGGFSSAGTVGRCAVGRCTQQDGFWMRSERLVGSSRCAHFARWVSRPVTTSCSDAAYFHIQIGEGASQAMDLSLFARSLLANLK
jgi:hypothetical protein